jgi:hypothetical protein
VAARECRQARRTSMSSNDSDIVPGPSYEPGPYGSLYAKSNVCFRQACLNFLAVRNSGRTRLVAFCRPELLDAPGWWRAEVERPSFV